jgi:hypothetical protein
MLPKIEKKKWVQTEKNVKAMQGVFATISRMRTRANKANRR